MKRPKPPASLEAMLQRLARESVKGDALKRPRAEILARTLWRRALEGDKRSVELLLDRLPVQAVPDPTKPEPPFDQYGRRSLEDLAPGLSEEARATFSRSLAGCSSL